MDSVFARARKHFHTALLSSVLNADAQGVPTNADRHSQASVAFASGILSRVGSGIGELRLAGQTSGRQFEGACKQFIEETYLQLKHLRPSEWSVESVGTRNRLLIAPFEQYAHLIALYQAAEENAELAALLSSDYTITPDIIISRQPEDNLTLNAQGAIVDDQTALWASLRKRNNVRPLLHASISCKWTIRSDRSQNSRSEALNLIRNRKGHLPHIAVVTGEPLPARIASIALGTGDIDCVYHFALTELVETVENLNSDSLELLQIMIDGKRLKDISDLPLDLAV
ncbi:MAG: restriction endonuclease [Acidobacteria bacterium]|nr:restriction endonuclease [Acidobacteriota bacterium]MBI3421985.1 restriction endonuclease [Acidobacteriota bacterium]